MILFVVNENSGNGLGKRAWETTERELLEQRTEYAKISAPSAKEAIQRAEALIGRQSVQTLVAVGGDGTVHSLLALALEHRLPLGLIPSGSGNDTARAFGIPHDCKSALHIIQQGITRAADIISLRRPDDIPQYSLISAAIGLDGAVAEDVNGSRYKRWCNRMRLGSLAYIIGLFRMLATFKPQTISVTADGILHEFPRGWLTAVANLPTYGGGLKICPDARPDDGRLDICMVHGCSALQLLLVFPSVLSGKHIHSRFVTMLKAREITVEAPHPLLTYCDGEPAGTTPVKAAVVPGELLFLVSGSG